MTKSTLDFENAAETFDATGEIYEIAINENETQKENLLSPKMSSIQESNSFKQSNRITSTIITTKLTATISTSTSWNAQTRRCCLLLLFLVLLIICILNVWDSPTNIEYFVRSTPKYDHQASTMEGTTPVDQFSLISNEISVSDYIKQHTNVSDWMIQHLQYAYTNVHEMIVQRTERFPSVQQRVQLYMSDWYIPPCDKAAQIQYQYNNDSVTVIELPDKQHQPRTFEFNSNFDGSHDKNSFDEVHFINKDLFINYCKHMYCKDSVQYIIPSFDRIIQQENSYSTQEDRMNQKSLRLQQQPISQPPILFQFGDSCQTRSTQYNKQKDSYELMYNPRLPVIQKARARKSIQELDAITNNGKIKCYKIDIHRDEQFHFQPIVYKLKTHRHYQSIFKVAEIEENLRLQGKEKKNIAIFRGALTGNYPYSIKKQVKQMSVIERCQYIPRCWITYTHSIVSSSLVDAKLTEPYNDSKMIPRSIPVVDGNGTDSVVLYGDRVPMEELLQYKALIMLEGNDLSTGLKWALFSNSVVMMPETTLTSWAMEELLQPWVHYVPINVYKNKSNGDTTISTDVEDKMQWIIDNESKVQEIIKASTLWIADLLLHPEVPYEEKEIFDEIARRYVAHFTPWK